MAKKESNKLIKRWRRYHEISDVGDITRRYFVMNSFDGALTMLGVIIGAYMAGILNPLPIISSGVAGSIAMGTSGFSGAYLTEKAERTKKLKELEKSMLTDLSNGLHYKSYRFAAIFAAIVDGVSPALAAMLVVSPFFLANFGLINTISAFYSSIFLTLISLLILGVYLAKISNESMIRYGLQMLLVGFITAILAFSTSILLGGSVV
jgi:predicted membrane protein (TIGR00267 family)